MVAKKVTADVPVCEVQIEHDNGLTETFGTTAEHPFYIDGLGWRKASVLEAGMILLDRHGKPTAKVIRQQRKDRTETVYNIEVQDFHTYHIGRIGVWVHNAKCCVVNSDKCIPTSSSFHPQGTIIISGQATRVNVVDGKTNFTPLRAKMGQPVSAGFVHVLEGHFGVPITNSRSVFTIEPNELKAALNDSSLFKIPVT